MRWVLALLLVLASTSCGGRGGRGVTASLEDGSVVSDSASSQSKPSRSDGSEVSTDAGAGTSPATDAAGVDDGGARSGYLFPLGTDYRWTYQVEQLGSSPFCSEGAHDTWVSFEREDFLGRHGYEIVSFCTGVSPNPRLYTRGEGETVEWYYQGNWVRELAEPVEEGASWDSGTDTFTWIRTWQHAGTVTVPAGTFHDCWTIVDPDDETQVYCPGVGLVHNHYEDESGNGWDAQLIEINF